MKSDEEDICNSESLINFLICFVDMAFLALGGDEEKKKSIDRQKLVSVIKDEFNLTIDIQVLKN